MFVRPILLLLLVFLIEGNLFSQTNKNIIDLKNQNKSISEKILTSEELLKQLSNKKAYAEKEKFSNQYAKWLYKNQQYTKGATLRKNSSNSIIIDTLLFSNQLFYMGLCEYKIKRYNHAIETFELLITLAHKKNNTLVAKSHSELGRCYNKKGDYYNAIKNYELGQSLLAKNNELNRLLINYINTSQAYINLKTKNSYLKSLKYQLKADSLSKKIKTHDKYKYYIKKGIARFYNRSETLDINKSSFYYNQALKIAKKLQDSFKIAEIYSQLGNLYNTNNPELSIKFQSKSLVLSNQKDTIQNYVIHTNLGFSYMLKEDFDTSLKHYLIAIEFITGIEIKKLTHLFNKKNNQLQRNTDYLLNLLKELATLYLKKYEKDLNQIHLKNCLKLYDIADQILELIRTESNEFKSKLFWRKQSAEVYSKAIEVCFLLKNPNQAFYFMEKSKALLLTEDIKNKHLRQKLKIPLHLVEKENQLKKSIYKLKNNNLNASHKDSINLILLSKQRLLRKLQDSIDYKLIKDKLSPQKINVISLTKVRQVLKKDEAIIEYNINTYDDYAKITPQNNYKPIIPESDYGIKKAYNSYGIIITQKTVDFFKIKNASTLQKQLESFNIKISKPFKYSQDFDTYKLLASQIFENLFPTQHIQNSIKNKKLTIIPDSYLNYLSFDALLVQKNEKTNYLIEQNEISYTYSNTFLNQIKKQELTSNLSLLSVAPIQFDYLNLAKLDHSKNEIHQLKKHFKNTEFILGNASKSNFISALPKYDVIHLATHANAQDSLVPWIAFHKEKLTLDEIYLYKNKAKLIVLNACNTLLGKQEQGEGVMSLARGFFHSGAESVVSSLWNVDDKATAKIMDTFYAHLKNGKSKATALRNAKLAYLKNHSLSERAPYYWASLVLLGNNDPLIKSSHTNWWYGLLALAISLFVMVLFKKYIF